ncbi:efflux RND transporter periplasmic adaptor subunit [Herminiimonas fonticola]|uniref:RND family efflux transporter MFP subunit n=1 Tax=Herminiimonas fonticola TaxID=303380 RepID=A0A4R6GFU9_9BURK|nr:efflux RND transporter periplasmic adaptor subunit [Herminiimonas fonticola]RBA24530.1 efflux transporter, RND family, MFP subunit [Herminiimonas fonticola]TDN93647.1 RND family efflux transporter MFP subunit [Herminiimonas fonticola]
MKRFKTKTIVIAAIVLVVLIASIVMLIGGKADAGKKKEDAGPKPALTVTTAQPSQARLPIKMSANGTITAWQEAIVGSESNGLRLTDVRVNVGDAVRKGQVLATFFAASTQADVLQARASVMEAEANAADAKNNAERARTLESSGALSTQQINQYLTTEQTAKAKADAARATLSAQELRLSQTQVLAPDDGVISARNATVGAVVGAGTELFRLIRQGRLEWRAEVTSTELGSLAAGTAALITAANGTKVKGKVRMIAPTVDTQNRSAIVYVDLSPAPTGASPARAGMFATGEFDLGMSSAITVPQQAIVIRDGFSYVFRLNTDNRVTQIKIQPGRRLLDSIEVVSGIDANAVVVANGAGFLNDGDLVKVVPATAPVATPTVASDVPAAGKPAISQDAATVKKAGSVPAAPTVGAPQTTK